MSYVIEKDLVTVQKENMTKYYKEVITNRAVPDPRDGLKPGQRSIQWLMYEEGFTSNKPHVKSARIDGLVVGLYTPHGVASTYDTMVKMYAPWQNSLSLIDKHGNFSSIYGDPAAADRYTEARLNRHAERYLLEELKVKNSVDYTLNYDNTRPMPKVLPAKLPMLLINGSFGIAAGYMTSIPNTNPNELLSNFIHYVKTDEYKVTPPDFPTGGILTNTQEVIEALEGKKKSSMRIRSRIIKDENKNTLTVTEIPYGKYLDTIIKGIKEATQDKKEGKKLIPKKIDGIKDIKNASQKGAIKLIIHVKRGFDLDLIENLLYKYTGLESSQPLSMVGSIGETFMKYDSQKQLADEFLDFRIETIKRIKMGRIKECKTRIHILEALLIVLANTDKYYKIIKRSSSKQNCLENVMEEFSLSDKQAKHVIEIPSYRLGSFGADDLRAERDNLDSEVLKEIEFFKNRQKLMDFIVSDFEKAMNDFKSIKRKTVLENLDTKDLLATVPDTDFLFLITEQGFIKKIDMEGQKIQKRGGKGTNLGKIKEDDVPKFNFAANNRETLYIFTDKGNLYTKSAYDIPEVNKNSFGLRISQFVDLKKDEKIVSVIGISKEETEKEDTALLFVTKKNRTKLTKLSEYKRTNAVIGTALMDGDTLFTVEKIDMTENNSIFCCLTNGIGINIKVDTVPFVSKSGYGSYIFDNTFFESDESINVTSANIVTGETSHICFITKEGLIKKVKISEFPEQIRRGKGRKCLALKGEDILLNSLSVNSEEDNIRIITNQMTIGTPITDIPESLRPAFGARCKQMQDGEEVIDMVIL